MTFLKIDQEAFDTERGVVEEECRLSLNQPYGTLMEELPPVVFAGRPYRWTPLGKIAHLRAASVGELRDFWTTHYVPNNATLLIVGALTHDKAQQLAERYFGWIPRCPDVPHATVGELPLAERRQFTFKPDKAPAPAVGIYYPTVRVTHQDYVPLSLLAHIAGDGHSSRIYRRLVAQDQLAAEAQSMCMSLECDGGLAVGALLPPLGGNPDAALAALTEEVQRLAETSVTEREFAKAKNNMLRGLVTEGLAIDSKARALGQAAVVEGDAARVNRRLDDIRRCTEEDLLRVARMYLVPERATEIRIERNLLGTLFSGAKPPEPAVTAAPEQEAPPPGRAGLSRPEGWPKTPPLAGLLNYDPTPRADTRTLDNGLKVMVVANHETPFVSVQLHLRGGAWTEVKPGAAAMAMAMLTKGTARHTEGEFADELETYAISMDGVGEMDSATVYAGCLTEHVERAMDLLAEAVLTPAFDEKELGKLKGQVTTELVVESAEPSYIVAREFRRRLYGDHPYARRPRGEVADVTALAVEDLRRWWEDSARPDMAWLIYAGDIDLDRAAALAEKALGSWRAESPKPEMSLPPFPEPSPTHIYLVDIPGTQAQIRVGRLGITRADPEYFTAEVVGNYFGEAFGSRLNKAVRVNKGLTYGAWGGYSAQRLAGMVTAGTFTNTETVAEAVRVVLTEFGRLRTAPPDEQELGDAKTYLVGSFAARRESPDQVAEDVWLIESYGLPADYFQRMLDHVAAVDGARCAALAQETVDTSQMVIAVAGPAKALQPALETIAPVTVVQPAGLLPSPKSDTP
jgi:zinc protease